MPETIKVAVSPFFGGEDWTDEKSGILFEKNPRGLTVYTIPTSFDLTGIKRAIQLNALILVEDNVGKFNEVNDVIIEEPKKEEAPVVEEPKAEPVAEEPAEEAEVEVKATKPARKTKSTKK